MRQPADSQTRDIEAREFTEVKWLGAKEIPHLPPSEVFPPTKYGFEVFLYPQFIVT